MSTDITLKIHTGSIPRGLVESGSEYRRLYEVIDEAARNGTPVTITRYGKVLRLVPAEDTSCGPCREGRHEDCLVVWSQNPAKGCGCDQRTVHNRIQAERVALYRASRRTR
jgi:hypothetical protein